MNPMPQSASLTSRTIMFLIETALYPPPGIGPERVEVDAIRRRIHPVKEDVRCPDSDGYPAGRVNEVGGEHVLPGTVDQGAPRDPVLSRGRQGEEEG